MSNLFRADKLKFPPTTAALTSPTYSSSKRPPARNTTHCSAGTGRRARACNAHQSVSIHTASTQSG
jgi:hypothetical protein